MVYKVAIRTQVGRFNSDIEIDINNDGTLTGNFEILNMNSTFSGRASDNNVEFTGKINTPIGELEYNAYGTIEGDDFHGIAKTRIGDFEFSPLVRRKIIKKRFETD